jgi:ribokinase
MPRIAVVGSANMDLVVRCGRLPAPGETAIGHGFVKNPGGKGANQAVAAGRLANGRASVIASRGVTQVNFVGCVGEDEHGKSLAESLSSAGVNIDYLRTTEHAPTGTALITVDDQGQNTIVVDPGANALLTSDHVARSLSEIAPDVTLVQLEIPEEAVYATAGNGLLILDPAPARFLEPEFLLQVEIATPNESETLAMTGLIPVDEFAQRRAAQALLEKGVGQAVLKLGAAGVYWTDGRHELRVPAPKIEAVDATAAGDAFAGALAVFLAEEVDTGAALKGAVKSASLSVTRRGAQAAMPTRAELDRVTL